MRLLLNKRNSSSMDQVLSALTDAARLDSGAVRKVFTLSGQQVTSLPQFFENEDVFFVYGNERFSLDDFELEFEESKAIQQFKKTPGLRNGYILDVYSFKADGICECCFVLVLDLGRKCLAKH